MRRPKFTAVQAAKKVTYAVEVADSAFTAVQAAKKSCRLLKSKLSKFTAVQAAKKKQQTDAGKRSYVHCRTGS